MTAMMTKTRKGLSRRIRSEPGKCRGLLHNNNESGKVPLTIEDGNEYSYIPLIPTGILVYEGIPAFNIRNYGSSRHGDAIRSGSNSSKVNCPAARNTSQIFGASPSC